MPMGSYHIIDGEKVSVRYSGQEWTCARCRQYKRDCPGAAVARECTADRVMLSSHMKEHWEKKGYQPDTGALNGVGEDLELEVQVGRNDRETNPVPESLLSSKYNSVIVKGFRTDTPIENIMEILSEYGLPESYEKESLIKNEITGSITIENIKPEECLSLSSRMYKKKFLRRQIVVTSVVANSPGKPAVQVQAEKTPEHLVSPQPQPTDPQPPNNANWLFLKLPLITHSSVSSPPTSPGVQQKIDQIEKQTPSTSITDTAADSSIKNRPEKRGESLTILQDLRNCLGRRRSRSRMWRRSRTSWRRSWNTRRRIQFLVRSITLTSTMGISIQ